MKGTKIIPMKQRINCIIVHKRQKTLNYLTSFFSKREKFNLIPFDNSVSEFSKSLIKNDVEIVFIETDTLNNPFLNLLNVIQIEATVVVISGKQKFAYECYGANIADFLLRPISENRLNQCAEKIVKEILKKRIFTKEKETEDMYVLNEPVNSYQSFKDIFISNFKCLVRVSLSDIICVERVGEVSIFSLEKGDNISTTTRLSKILVMLPTHHFARINRSQIICLDKVKYVKGNVLTIDGKAFTVSRNYIGVLKEIRQIKLK